MHQFPCGVYKFFFLFLFSHLLLLYLNCWCSVVAVGGTIWLLWLLFLVSLSLLLLCVCSVFSCWVQSCVQFNSTIPNRISISFIESSQTIWKLFWFYFPGFISPFTYSCLYLFVGCLIALVTICTVCSVWFSVFGMKVNLCEGFCCVTSVE